MQMFRAVCSMSLDLEQHLLGYGEVESMKKEYSSTSQQRRAYPNPNRGKHCKFTPEPQASKVKAISTLQLQSKSFHYPRVSLDNIGGQGHDVAELTFPSVSGVEFNLPTFEELDEGLDLQMSRASQFEVHPWASTRHAT
jgi:hypothetical protein